MNFKNRILKKNHNQVLKETLKWKFKEYFKYCLTHMFFISILSIKNHKLLKHRIKTWENIK